MDVQSSEQTVGTSDSGLTPRTILKGCTSAQNGVSVRNMPERKDGYEWYVFRANRGREDKAYQLLESLQAATYLPRHTVYSRTKSGVKPLVKKLMPYFVFAYLTEYEARLFTKGPKANDQLFRGRSEQDQKTIRELNILLSFYYNHFVKGDDGMNPPLIIPYGQMEKFFIATRLEKDVMPVEPGAFHVGETVQVVEGEFAGLVGRVIRVDKSKKRLNVRLTDGDTMVSFPQEEPGQRRLFFQLPCLGSFSSASIPTAYFRKID